MDNNEVLTTIDNPYNPKTDYDKWKQWDEDNGYYTTEYLARVVFMDAEDADLSDEIKMNELHDKAIQSILDNDILGVYTVV